MVSRREFLKAGAAGCAGISAFPYIIRAGVLGNSSTPPANSRITLGHIGVGGQGGGLLGGFLNLTDCQSVAVCDCFKERREKAAERIKQTYQRRREGTGGYVCDTYTDFRELLARPDIDAVVIATPDHWHVSIALCAVQAGKDIYLEKPMGLSIEQDKLLRSAVRTCGRVFQYGTQQRSFSRHCSFACELVRNGMIGKIKEIRVEAPGGAASGGSVEPIPVPEGLDYDMWLGPAPYRPYTKDRCTHAGSWHCYDNSLGFIAGWGAHPLDVMHWGYPHIPVEYEGDGFIPTEGLFDAIAKWNIKGRFADGVSFEFKDGPDSTTFVGEEGWVRASRGDMDAHPKSLLKAKIAPGGIRLFQQGNHHQNFLDAIKKRVDAASDIDSAVQSDFISHLSNIAIRMKRKIRWDTASETILDDTEAQRMAVRPMRSPWTI